MRWTRLRNGFRAQERNSSQRRTLLHVVLVYCYRHLISFMQSHLAGRHRHCGPNWREHLQNCVSTVIRSVSEVLVSQMEVELQRRRSVRTRTRASARKYDGVPSVCISSKRITSWKDDFPVEIEQEYLPSTPELASARFRTISTSAMS